MRGEPGCRKACPFSHDRRLSWTTRGSSRVPPRLVAPARAESIVLKTRTAFDIMRAFYDRLETAYNAHWWKRGSGVNGRQEVTLPERCVTSTPQIGLPHARALGPKPGRLLDVPAGDRGWSPCYLTGRCGIPLHASTTRSWGCSLQGVQFESLKGSGLRAHQTSSSPGTSPRSIPSTGQVAV